MCINPNKGACNKRYVKIAPEMKITSLLCYIKFADDLPIEVQNVVLVIYASRRFWELQ